MTEIPGHATTEGTASYASSARKAHAVAPEHFRSFQGLTLGSLGVGTYLGDLDTATDRLQQSALVASLRSGVVNVLDTAINYRSQRAERTVGRALAEAVRGGTLGREQVFVSTKNGYLAPDAEAGVPPRLWLQQELLGTGALRPQDIVGGSHAMSVPYLRDQLARSLRNLGLSTVDLMYLHNAAESQLEAVGRAEFMARLRAAFTFYEEARGKARIRSYGLATWDSLREGRTSAGYLGLSDVVDLAREVGGPDHGFRYVQFPFNLAMPEAAILRNQMVQGDRVTLFEAAHRLGVGTFTSVPLLQGQVLSALQPLEGLTRAQSALQIARSAPHHLTALVGQKTPEHVRENLGVGQRPPLDEAAFRSSLED